MGICRTVCQGLLITVICTLATFCVAQAMPATGGETLSGKRIVPAEAVLGHPAILVAGFSHEAGNKCGAWMKAVHTDAALNGVAAYELAMLEKAPGFIRGTIKSGMRKGTTPEEQNQMVVLTQDQKLWERFFDVRDEKDPYVVMLDAKGEVIWHGHGAAANLEPLLKTVLRR
jgi:hypothetical protein